jgi:hypothetical protein
VENIAENVEVEPSTENAPPELPEHRAPHYVPTLSPIPEVSEPATSIDGTNDPQSKPEEVGPVAETAKAGPKAKDEGVPAVAIQGVTLTSLRKSANDANIPKPAPLENVDVVLTQKQEMAMKALQDAIFKSKELLPPKLYEDILTQQQIDIQKLGSIGIDNHPPSKYPDGFHHEKVHGGNMAANKRPQAIGFGPGHPPGVEVPMASAAANVPGFVAVATQDPMAKFLKPAGIAAAGLAGVGALVGVVWLFDKVKGFFSRKHNDDEVNESRKRRRHVRDWTVSN